MYHRRIEFIGWDLASWIIANSKKNLIWPAFEHDHGSSFWQQAKNKSELIIMCLYNNDYYHSHQHSCIDYYFISLGVWMVRLAFFLLNIMHKIQDNSYILVLYKLHNISTQCHVVMIIIVTNVHLKHFWLQKGNKNWTVIVEVL